MPSGSPKGETRGAEGRAHADSACDRVGTLLRSFAHPRCYCNPQTVAVPSLWTAKTS
jgi:hypothetical protein